jgi:mono/diheme cytochrome c family protein
MNRTFRIMSAVTILFVLIFVSAAIIRGQEAGGNAAAKAVKAPASTPKSVATGEKLFRTYCRLCHGSDGKGDGPQAPKDAHPPDLTDAKWDRGSTDGEIFDVIRNGAGPKFVMKGYRSILTEQEIWSLVHYLRSIGPQGSH